MKNTELTMILLITTILGLLGIIDIHKEETK